MDKKHIFEELYKNRWLILICTVLILGSFFGTSITDILPENICKNIFEFMSEKTESFTKEFINIFSFPFAVLFTLYLSGLSIPGYISSFVVIFIFGMINALKNSIIYMFLGSEFVIENFINFLTADIILLVMIIVMAESSFFASKKIIRCIKNTSDEKPIYNAKNNTVKLITFTAIFVIISSFSAYLRLFIFN